MSETVPEINITGNIAVMRAALLTILGDARKVCKMDRDAIAKVCKDALSAPPRNCDVASANDLHAAFVRHCEACNPPGGCCHRADTRGMLDTGCASILKCFARFALDTVEKTAHEETNSN